MTSHCPSVDADQVHSRAAETAIVPDPPAAGTLPPPLAATLHRVRVVGEVAVVAEEPQPARASTQESDATRDENRAV
jgi:hypothetical protein